MIGKAIEKIYRDTLFTRKEPDGTIRYFSAEDFPGLKVEPFVFTAGQGHSLQGYFYSYEDKMPERLTVFDHGMGKGGHRAYMKEIVKIASKGCTVFAYDHTGCVKSGGQSNNGFAQSLNDLDACLSAIKKHPVYGGRSLSVIGHSWGAFSTLNVIKFHPDVKNAVAMSGFISVERMVGQFFKGILSPFRKRILAIEREVNPVYSRVSALDTLRETKVNVLVVHSLDDKTVLAKYHFDVLRKGLESKDNVRFLPLTGKNHNPNYTIEAVKYLNEFFSTLQRKQKQGKLKTEEEKEAFLNSYDWHKMTEQDEEVWEEIFKTLFA